MRFVHSLFVLLILAYGARASTQCPALTIMPLSLPGAVTGRAYSQDVNVLGGSGRYSFAIIANSLPPGLGLNVSSGVISGTPTTIGSFSFLLRVTDSNGCTGTRAYTIEVVCGAAGIGPSTLPAAQIGVAYSQNFSASNGKPPYSYLIASGALPNGLTLDANGRLRGTPLAGTTGTWTFDVAVVDDNPCGTAKGYSLVVTCPVITVHLSTLSAGTTGVPFSQTLSASGGTGPYSFGTQASALPPGLTLSTSGVLSGTPTAPGTYSFIVRSTDANGCFGERSYSQVITGCPTIAVNPATLAGGQVGLAYSLVFSASGGTGPYTFRISTGALPPGMSFINGSVSGSPATAGSYAFSIQATDANGCKGERAYTLVVNTPTCPAITIPNILPVPFVGTSYSQTFSATGGTGPYFFSIPSGVLPPGLTLSSNGHLNGTPTSTGTFTFAIRATDSNGCSGERTYTLGVQPCQGIEFSPYGPIPSGRVGVVYSLTLTPSGGSAPYTFILGTSSFLPAGLTLSTGGLLSGTPTTGGHYTFIILVTSANGCIGQKLCFINIDDAACPDIEIDPSTLTSIIVGDDYTQTLLPSGGVAPYSFVIRAGSLPPGLSLAINGKLSGRPTAAGSYSFTVRATDANGCSNQRTYSLVVNSFTCPNIVLSPAALPAGVTGASYSQSVNATGGTGPYSFVIGSATLPAGLSLSSNGNLTGLPAAAGNFTFSIRATDANSCAGERSYGLTIAPSVLTSVSAASFAPSGPLAPESIVAAFGASLTHNTEAALTQPLPTKLADMTLVVRDSAGIERLAPLYFASASQVNYQLPPGTSLGRATLTLLNEGALANISVVAAGILDVAQVAPGLFSADSRGSGLAAAQVFRVKSTGAQSYEAVARYDSAQNKFVAEPIDFGPVTDQVFLVLYGTGFKFKSSLSSVSCTVAGMNSEVLYAGEVLGYVGLEQINVRLSRSLAGRGEVDVTITVDGKPANPVRVAFR